MLFNVPQYIDVEDKVVGPLTVKQLLWMIAAGMLTLIMWAAIPSKPLFFILAVPEVLFFVALAFYKPYGQPLIGFVFSGIMFLFGPKIYVWKRSPQQKKSSQALEDKRVIAKADANSQRLSNQEERRSLALSNLSGIAKILDSDGQQSDADVVDILKKPEVK